MFLPWSASATAPKRAASFSAFLQPTMTRGRVVASETDFAMATQSSTEALAPLGSAL